MEKRRAQCDWQNPDFLDEIDLDAEEYISRLAGMGVEALSLVCKSAFGNCHYPSKVGYTNPSMAGDGDVAGRIRKLARQHKIRFIAYFNMLLDNHLAKSHPEWKQVDAAGEPLKSYTYHVFCMNRTEYTEYVYRHLEEITRILDPDAFFFDIQYFNPKGCFCDACRSAFSERSGYELDLARFETIEQWHDFIAFQRDTRKTFIRTAIDRCKKLKSNLDFTWNGSGNPSKSHVDLDQYADLLTTEAHPPGYPECCFKSRWMQSSGKPFELTTPETIHSWGDWTVVPARTLKTLSSITMAHGGALNIDLTPLPCGDYGHRVFPAIYETAGEAYALQKHMAPFCDGATSVPVGAILHSPENAKIREGFDWRRQYTGESQLWDDSMGTEYSRLASRLLSEIHVPTDLIYDERSLERIDEYEFVVLPNIGFVDETLAARLKQYVKQGGTLVATHNTSLLDAHGVPQSSLGLGEVFGFDFDRFSDYSVVYVDGFADPIAKKLPDVPLLVKDTKDEIKPNSRALYGKLRSGAEALAYFTEPVLESDFESDYHIYHQHAPPGKRTGIPAIIRNTHGKGQAIFLPFELLKTYKIYGRWHRELFRSVLDAAGLPRKAIISCTPSVLVVLTEDERRWILHLINAQKENDSILIEESSSSGPVHCFLRPGFVPRRIVSALTRAEVAFDVEQDGIRFVVPDVREHEIIEIERTG